MSSCTCGHKKSDHARTGARRGQRVTWLYCKWADCPCQRYELATSTRGPAAYQLVESAGLTQAERERGPEYACQACRFRTGDPTAAHAHATGGHVLTVRPAPPPVAAEALCAGGRHD